MLSLVGIHSFFPEELVDKMVEDGAVKYPWLKQASKLQLLQYVAEAIVNLSTKRTLCYQDSDGKLLVADSDLELYIDNLAFLMECDVSDITEDDDLTDLISDSIEAIVIPLTGYLKNSVKVMV